MITVFSESVFHLWLIATAKKTVHIPLSFGDAVRGLLKVDPKQLKKRVAKKKVAKKAARKPTATPTKKD